MGNSASQQAEQASVFSLSDELQEQMAKEYNNEQIVKLFGKQMEKLSERKGELLKEKVEQRTAIEQRMEKFRAQNKKVQEQLDQAIESYEDKFADTASALEYDAARLEKKYLKGNRVDTPEIPCLAERSDIAACYKTYKGSPGACDALVEALTECASKKITAKQ
mmetsp:Transcript_44299/g.128089  ORF Transcript_44299/g.128089 Transcript_44299/m.128089 type:complete len:164 (-) Transcript_44299:33-524(-)